VEKKMEVRKIKVNTAKPYEIVIRKGLLSHVHEYILKLKSPCKAFIVTDNNVASFYLGIVKKSLTFGGFTVYDIVLPAGEATKSLKNLELLYDRMLSEGITRSDLIIALGGGVIGDLAGFCAATLLRGIDYVQIPTSLLSQVDSSVGGKVAVNIDRGKNLVGAFYQPIVVLIDPLCLKTLDERVLSDGMAEVIKYGCIYDESLFLKLVSISNNEEFFEESMSIIERCCDIKRRVVEEDEFDTGKRMILNFGHTLGHAYEKMFNYEKLTHGEAVSIGMVEISKFGEKLGITKRGVSDKIERLLKRFNLPSNSEKPGIDAFIEALKLDKKGQGAKLNIVLLEDIGRCVIHKIDAEDLISFITEG